MQKTRVLLTAFILTSTAQTVRGVTIFLSGVGTVGSGVAVGNQDEAFADPTATGEALHVWIIPNVGLTLNAVSLNLLSTNPGIIQLTDVTVHNPFLTTIESINVFRWQSILEPGPSADFVSLFQGIVVANNNVTFGLGIGPGSQDLDTTGYDAASGAWLFATLAYDVIGVGSTDLFLQIGENGIVPPPLGVPADIDAEFGGSGDPPLNAETDRSVNSATPDGSIVSHEAGDLTGDGFVGANDLISILNFWGQTVPLGDLMMGDVLRDGFVGGDDLSQVLNNWGAITQVGAFTSLTTVPEPTSLCLLALGGVTVGCLAHIGPTRRF